MAASFSAGRCGVLARTGEQDRDLRSQADVSGCQAASDFLPDTTSNRSVIVDLAMNVNPGMWYDFMNMQTTRRRPLHKSCMIEYICSDPGTRVTEYAFTVVSMEETMPKVESMK